MTTPANEGVLGNLHAAIAAALIEKIDKAKRKPVPSVMCSHCPFCGEKLAGE